MTSIEVLLVGPAKDLAGAWKVVLELEDHATLSDLRRELLKECPALQEGIDSMRFAVNDEFCADDRKLEEGDKVSLIPPVCGGSESAVWAEIVASKIDVDKIREFAKGDTKAGCTVTFEGSVREECHPEHGKLNHLFYEAHDTMALKQLKKLADGAISRWQATRIAVVHRVGRVEVGEAPVVVAVSCPHRQQAFEACRVLLDELKKDVPIWKKDVFESGHEEWVKPAE